MNPFIEELRWRGMLQDMTPEIEEHLNKGMASAYLGFDPTADSLHIGHLVGVMTLLHFQRAGHKPFALVGGATGMIGDPSFKSAERNLLDKATLDHNVASIQNQLAKFLDFGQGTENKAELVNNYDWMAQFSFLEFIRDVGKHITVNYMMAKDSVKRRLEDGNGLSFTEFSYQLIQGYDFFHLWKNNNCSIQLGGSDQWGNIVTGTELIRRMGGGSAYALTVPLITKADGTKFGKTEGGSVWLDPEKTSPYAFYQFWLNVSDEDASKYIRIFTTLDRETIENLEKEHAEAPHQRALQKEIAKQVTIMVHSAEDYEMAVKASDILFGKSSTEDLASLDERTFLQVFDGVPQVKISAADYQALENTLDLFGEISQGVIFGSKGEARKMIQGGGVSVNKEKLGDPNAPVSFALLQGKYLLVQKGKKNYFIVEII
ncbi:tyrosine--tRNA ligase [Algoriphagus zhangzhouensis]|uniref:Tyrosine--tRNA ligase n=1 Tax=Algoriphagus zhangzhouensis TaxID=1073327 RepID=A0A1M7Z632_9BACT|nr:tyrosine--tRNA ligase [Algoriphagus zhangzhouensis]TDY49017.1 tyrosyl-tRNA synthetase [Algoriphagus zhangzhouensis]SHO60304.1 tyrosyl-tRNA synthetase [Algoriphagus zhangzhouensis]